MRLLEAADLPTFYSNLALVCSCLKPAHSQPMWDLFTRRLGCPAPGSELDTPGATESTLRRLERLLCLLLEDPLSTAPTNCASTRSGNRYDQPQQGFSAVDKNALYGIDDDELEDTKKDLGCCGSSGSGQATENKSRNSDLASKEDTDNSSNTNDNINDIRKQSIDRQQDVCTSQQSISKVQLVVLLECFYSIHLHRGPTGKTTITTTTTKKNSSSNHTTSDINSANNVDGRNNSLRKTKAHRERGESTQAASITEAFVHRFRPQSIGSSTSSQLRAAHFQLG